MNRLQSINGLQFYYNPALHEQVNPITTIQVYTAIAHREGLLPLDSQPPFNQFMCEAYPIR